MRHRTGGVLILLISIAAGLLAAFLAVGYLQGVAETAVVLVANREIPPFTPLSPTMFTAERWPAPAVPADALQTPAALQGRYSRALILQGSAVRQGHLAGTAGAGGSLAARLTETGDPNSRALAIPVDNTTGVGGTVQPGDRVDIIAAVQVEREKAPAVTFSKIIARAVPVLHRTEGEDSAGATVVLQVTPAVAEEIAYVQLAGRIYLATNPYRIDESAPPTEGVTPEQFLERHAGR
ncbi:MAG: Flp pilus assembly protein CpaB [Bacillota bacterium]